MEQLELQFAQTLKLSDDSDTAKFLEFISKIENAKIILIRQKEVIQWIFGDLSFLSKTSQKRGRLLDSTRKILGDGVADTLDSVIPDPLSPAVASAPTSAPVQDTEGELALQKELASYKPIQDTLSPAVASAPVDNTEGELALQKELASYKPIQGGKTKRFSKKLRKNGKWRTQRNKFVK